MATDIHVVFQKKVVKESGEVEWVDIDSRYENNRHYTLFGWIADVHNGYGFAGSVTGDAIPPIAYPRGLPEDFSVDDECDHNGTWMGDHSYSWLTGEEIIGGLDHLLPTRRTGVLSRKAYLSWDKKSEPTGYTGGVFGNGVLTVRQGSTASECRDGYSDRLYEELVQQVRKTRYKLRVPDTRYDWRRTPNAKPSKLKHLNKLRRYAKQVGTVYVSVNWMRSADVLKYEFRYFTDEIQRLMDEHGEIRMVFGFDS